MLPVNFNTQVMGHSKQLQYFALSLTSNSENAKDLLQETLMKAFIYRNNFMPDTNLKAWLHTIMKNIFINDYRRVVKRRTIIDGSKDLFILNAPQVGSAYVAESKMNEKAINRAIANLDDEYKTPFELYIKGYKYKEIAEYLDIPLGTIKSRIFLARKELMVVLKNN